MDYNFTATGSINGPVLAAVFAVEAVVGFIANIIVLSITLHQRKSFKQPSTIFFTSLILSNLLDALIYLPMTAIATGAEEWILGSTFEQRRATCVFAGIISWINVYIITGVLAAISFDKCLFITKPYFYKRFMKPWVALAIIVVLSIIVTLMFTLPSLGFGEYDYLFDYGPCYVAFRRNRGYVIFCISLLLSFIIIIMVTSIWTFCFTHRFIRDHSEKGGDSVYNTQRLKLFGIFGSMLLAYGTCYGSVIVTAFISYGIQIPEEVDAATIVAFHANPIVTALIQSYFRPDITKPLKSFKNAICSKLKKMACSFSN
uniref:G-protein coupled receptors family 1 profile domain-containing protein n=1 Tax=Amphimedon queenslandica TaxID=400682 RepID=A0A1X7VBY7_AMPQE